MFLVGFSHQAVITLQSLHWIMHGGEHAVHWANDVEWQLLSQGWSFG